MLMKMYHFNMQLFHIQFAMTIYTVYALIKATFTLAIMKQNHDFSLSFILNLDIFLKILKPFSIARPVTYYFMYRYHQLHS